MRSRPEALMRQWRRAIMATVWLPALSAAAIGLGYGLNVAGYWLVTTLGVQGYVWIMLLRHLGENHPPGEPHLYPNLGLGTRITLARGSLIALLAGCFLLPPDDAAACWIAGALYLPAVVADFLDGYAARRTGHVTRLGEVLDMRLDALGLLAASAVAVRFGRLPAVYLAAGASYYLFNAALWAIRRLGLPVHEVRPWTGARVIAGFQMGTVAAALLPPVDAGICAIAAILYLIPLLGGFIRDWLIVCGYLTNAVFETARMGRYLKTALLDWLPVILRWGAALGLAAGGPDSAGTALETTARGMAAFFLATGVMARTAAAGAVFLIGSGFDADPLEVVILSAALLLMMTGSGRFSLWKPEDRFLLRKVSA